jgi:hypothetical protein
MTDFVVLVILKSVVIWNRNDRGEGYHSQWMVIVWTFDYEQTVIDCSCALCGF